MAGDDNEMFMTAEQHLIACSDKSAAYMTKNKRLLNFLNY